MNKENIFKVNTKIIIARREICGKTFKEVTPKFPKKIKLITTELENRIKLKA